MSKRRLFAVQPVGKVVVESVVGEALVDWQSDVVEPCDLHDVLSPVVVQCVEGCVADHLEHPHHRLVGDVAAGNVVAE